MKNIIIVFIAFLFAGITNPIYGQSKDLDQFTVQVEGLGCPFCAYGLEKKFKELKGIKKVKIEMETGIMNFEYPAKKALTIAAVEKQVEKAGYTPVAVSIQRGDGTVEAVDHKAKEMTTGTEMQTLEFFVAGNCGMCQARIENTAMKMDGVQSAAWDKDSKLVTITAAAGVTQEMIEKAIAKSGHDTKTAKAESSVYKALPGCCHYDREQ